MTIRIATEADIADWVELRVLLWPGDTLDVHRAEVTDMLQRSDAVAFLSVDETAGLQGFAEAALRRDHVNGCETSPVGYLEGLFVRSDLRGAGIGMALTDRVRDWAVGQGCSELASDVDLDNRVSQSFHEAAGFEETERVVYYRLRL
ncbi:aminoglycoside 6'-N-acetyltransferase [Gymnodinialimonas ceratoperidinii]|uniref:Aminoglycoside N(6')-acetyltransferase type 1 n=1 Tax=Gymnodinialimonas ceratoperidinii TaxID=2856823 RepID=A0A8F6TUS0_9RHOB|nr:aminoglycoside 6'-N-acetyltransferase [Gymnodinialimonas ceratoperidinii]QXT38147.1 GNAT family N-acetyltransferase [Gymnodinialimonas ceratoperidinii]